MARNLKKLYPNTGNIRPTASQLPHLALSLYELAVEAAPLVDAAAVVSLGHLQLPQCAPHQPQLVRIAVQTWQQLARDVTTTTTQQ